jgi:integrase
MAQTPRLTSEEKRKLTLRELLTLEGAQKPKVAGEVKSHIKRLEGILDPKTGVAVLDIPVDQMNVGQVMGDIITDSPFKDLDVESTAYRSHSSSLITRLNTLWAGAGYGTGYVKNEVESYLTPDVFAEESGWKYLRARKTPTGFPDDTYQKLKGILADPSIPEQNRLQLGAYLFGGFRPENLGSFKIENYDRQGGTLTFYDAKSKKNKVVVLNPVAQDFMNQAIGERTNGPILWTRTVFKTNSTKF